MIKVDRLAQGRFAKFQANNPNLDLRSFDFIDPRPEARLDWSGYSEEDRQVLMTYQRLLRLVDDPSLAERLLAQGLRSAHHIARLPERQFITRYGADLGLDEADLRRLHRLAVQTKLRAQLLAAALKGTAGSPHYRAGNMSNLAADVTEYIQAIPSYQDFFGSLDYCHCDHDQSIFGPSAYLVDMLRVVYQDIDNATLNPDIPDGWHLHQRRPDLENIPLTLEMTRQSVPYLQIVNEVLVGAIARETGWTDVYRELSAQPYPFACPFIQPLVRTRAYLVGLGASLLHVYQTTRATDTSPPDVYLPSDQQIGQEALRLNPTLVEVVSTSLNTASAIGAQYGVADGRILSTTATGTVSISADQTGVTGNATQFTSEVQPGDLVQVEAERRAVLTVSSDTRLTVDSAWTASATGKPMTVFPRNDLGTTAIFDSRTGLSFEALTRLIRQGLDDTEVAAGVPGLLFINQKQAPEDYLAIQVDRSDPNTPVSRIRGQGLNSLDRLNRLIRLSAASGIGYAELDWLIQSVGGGEISPQSLGDIGRTRLLADTLGLALDEAVGLFAVLKTIGVGDPGRPLDIFDRLFNAPAVLGSPEGATPPFTAQGTVTVATDRKTVNGNGSDFSNQIASGMRVRIGTEVRVVDSVVSATQLTVTAAFDAAPSGVYMVAIPSPETPSDALPVYHPQYSANPLYTDPLVSWDPNAPQGVPANVRGRLRAALGVSDGDLTLIGNQTLTALIYSGDLPVATTELPLSVPNLSRMYGYAKLAQQTRLTVAKLMSLLNLLEVTGYSSLDDAISITDWAVWLRDSRLNPYALEYALLGTTSKSYTPVFTLAQLPNFLASTWVLANDWLIHPDGFVNQDIDNQRSQSFFTQLIDPDHAFLSPDGAVLDVTIDYSAVAFIDPVAQDAFVSPLIDHSDSAEAWLKLGSEGVLDDQGILSADFNRQTPLSYLFPNNPNQTAMIAEVRAVLLATQRRIDQVVSVLTTFGGAPMLQAANQGIQRRHLSEQLAVLLGSSADTMLELGPYVAADVGLSNYVAAFLRPPGGSPGHWDPPPQDIQDFMVELGRIITAVNELKLTAADVAVIISNPQPFGLTSLYQASMNGIRGVWTYKRLQQDFHDSEGRLADYLLTPAKGDCVSDPKMQVLATLTGWPLSGICTLRAALYGDGDGYSTVLGVARMQACFLLGDLLALDMSGLIQLAALSALPATVDDASWSAYNEAATAAVGSFKARHGGPDWGSAVRPAADTINEASRDALAAYALFCLNARFKSITNSDGLYDYLLLDVEMSGCADISYIKQAILSVQLYMQRARMMLEPGIVEVGVPDVWWSWLDSYRAWEANRKVFLYPENYVEPGLRTDKTPQFQAAQDNLTANDITPATVNDTYVQYFEDFTVLASLKQVGAFYGDAPDPDAQGAIVPTLFLLARTPTAPYTYYLQRQVNDLLWTAFESVDLTVSSPTVAPMYAFDRLFLFWVEQDVTSASEIKDGGATNSATTQTTIRYSFVNYSGNWVPPQTLAEVVIAFQPMQGGYKTAELNPDSFNIREMQWRTVSPLLVKGANAAQDRLLVNYGLFYNVPTGDPSPPTAPNRNNIPNPEAWSLANSVYESSQYAVYANQQGVTGVTFAQQGRFLDAGLNVSPTYVIAYDYTMSTGSPQPYFPFIPRTVLQPDQVPTVKIFQTNNTFLINYMGLGANYSFFPSDPPLELLYNVSDRAGYAAPVVNQPFWFLFDNGDETFLLRSTEPGIRKMEDILKAHAGTQTNQTNLVSLSYTLKPQSFDSIVWSTTRLSTGAVTRMNQALYAGGVDLLLAPQTQVTPDDPLFPFSRFYKDDSHSPNLDPPQYADGDTIDYNGPYGLYFWEVYLYIPWLVANQLRSSQRYADARKWLEYIFNPTIAKGADPTVDQQQDRFWRLVAFRGYTLENLRQILTNPAQILAYNNYPFQPHVIARLRPGSYQKAIVMRYVDLLLEWGDYEFTKDTWESLTDATLLYILARELLGPKPVDVGACTTQPPATFKDIQDKYGDGIPQFLIDMENAVPPMETPDALLGQSDRYVPFNELDAYFCVPENAELTAYWDKVEDRLYKIRHCMNIQGVVRKLALFEPPIDPHALVRAAAAGTGAQVVTQLQTSAPPYRFASVFAIARDFTGQLSQIGGLLLSTLEKKDAEALAQLRAGQETRILGLTTRTLELQIQEIEEGLNGLDVSRQAALARQNYYQGLIDEGLLPAEQLHVAMIILSNVFGAQGSIMKGLASVARLLPNVGSPFAMTYGGKQIGASLEAGSGVFDALSAVTRAIGDVSQAVGGFERRSQEWTHQLTQAEFDVAQLDSQISATRLQLEATQRQLEINKQSIANSTELEAFLKDKFTNEELYEWMIGRISTVYGQAYRLALELAMAAQQAFQFELNSTDQFISFEYWDSARRGLLAGEQLMLSLTQMEKAYYQKNTRSMEIEKTISLLSLNPKALLDLKESGTCSFNLSEYLFDLDYPGHYARQIKSVSITIPAIVGPNQNIKATLSQLGNQILIKPSFEGVDFLLGLGSDTPDTSELRANWRASQMVALSSGLDDSGVFELNFNDERYLPFEGTGAVSSWRLEMPKASNMISYDSISDVILRLRYTAFVGDNDFADYVRGKIDGIPYSGQRAFNLAVELPGPWYAFMHPQAGATQQSLQFPMCRAYFPSNLTLTQLTEVYAQVALAQDITLGGTFTATLQIGTSATETLRFDPITGLAKLTDLSISDWVGVDWTLTVAKDDIPSGIADPDTGLIDPSKLLSIGLLLGYDANRA